VSDLITHAKDGVMIIDFETTSILDQAQIKSVAEELTEIATSDGLEHVLIDLNRVDFMSSAMIGEFLAFNTKCVERKADVKICNLSPDLKQLFQVTQLSSVFDVHSSRSDAMDAFAKGA